MPGRLANASAKVRQPKALISLRVITLTAAATSFCFCSYFEAPTTVTSSNCSRLSDVTSVAARVGTANAAPAAHHSTRRTTLRSVGAAAWRQSVVVIGIVDLCGKPW